MKNILHSDARLSLRMVTACLLLSAPVLALSSTLDLKPPRIAQLATTPDVIGLKTFAKKKDAKGENDAKADNGFLAQMLENDPYFINEEAGPPEQELRKIFYEAVQRAAERRPEMRLAYANFQAAQADVDEAKGQRLPQVGVSAQSKAYRLGSNASGVYDAGNVVSLNVTTPVYNGGRIDKTIASREQAANANLKQYEVQRENSAYEVMTTLIELGKQRVITSLNQEYVDRMEVLVRMLGDIVAVDSGRLSELTQAKARLLQAQASRDMARASVRNARINLTKLVGDEPVHVPRTRVWNIEKGNLSALLTQSADHPGIDQARSEASAADLNADAVRAASMPQINWVVSANSGRDTLGRRQPWETRLTLNWNAFQGGSASAAAEAAARRAESSWQRVELQRRDIDYQLGLAEHNIRTLTERTELYRDLSSETDYVRKAFFEQWYHLGRRTLLDVLTAESDYYGNRVAQATSRFDSYAAIVGAHNAAGGLVRWLSGE